MPWRSGALADRLAVVRAWAGPALLTPAAVLLLFFFLLPIGLIMVRSVNTPGVGLQNYVALWQAPANARIMKTTFLIAFWTAAICLLVAYPYAFHLTRLPKRLAAVFLFLSLVPLLTAILARLYAWTIILGRRGIINELLMLLGIHNPGEILFTRAAVLIGMVHVMLPYMIVVLYSVMVSISSEFLDASRTLGAGPVQTFFRVYLPLSMPGIYAGFLLVFIVALGFFITPAVLGGGGDITIAVYVEQQVSVLSWGTAAAMSMVLLVVTVVLFLVFDRLFGTRELLVGGLRR